MPAMPFPVAVPGARGRVSPGSGIISPGSGSGRRLIKKAIRRPAAESAAQRIPCAESQGLQPALNGGKQKQQREEGDPRRQQGDNARKPARPARKPNLRLIQRLLPPLSFRARVIPISPAKIAGVHQMKRGGRPSFGCIQQQKKQVENDVALKPSEHVQTVRTAIDETGAAHKDEDDGDRRGQLERPSAFRNDRPPVRIQDRAERKDAGSQNDSSNGPSRPERACAGHRRRSRRRATI